MSHSRRPLRTPSTRTATKAAAIAFRFRAGEAQIALVTRSGRKGWVCPKGNVEAGESPAQAAAREAVEEAGLRGDVLPRAVGRYAVSKGTPPVEVYLLRVTSVLARWPESGWRRRRWVSLAEARRSVGHAGLARLLAVAAERIEALASRRRAAS